MALQHITNGMTGSQAEAVIYQNDDYLKGLSEANTANITSLMDKVSVNASNIDSLQRRTLGEFVETPTFGATVRYDFQNNVLSAGNIVTSVATDRLFSWSGQTDGSVSSASDVSYKGTGISTTGRTGNTIVLTAVIGTLRTTNPMVGLGWDNGSDKVSVLLRSTGQISSYVKGIGFTDYQVATPAQAYSAGDTVTIEIKITSTGVTFRCGKNGVYSPYYSFAKVLAGNFYVVNRGSLDFTAGKIVYKTYSDVQQNIDDSLVLAKAYADTKDGLIQAQINTISIASLNLLPPIFTANSYWKVGGDGSPFDVTGWIRTTNRIPVQPNTQYTFCGIDTQFVGNEFTSSDVFVRNIAPDSPTNRYSYCTFTTSPTTTKLGLNITSPNGTDSSAKAMLVLGAVIPSAFETYGDVYVNAVKIRGDIPAYTKTDKLIISYPSIYYAINTTGYGGKLLVYVYVKYSPTSKYYIRYQVANDFDNTARKDLYRIVGADLFLFDGVTMISQSKALLTGGESEFVIHQQGKTDFTGGFHGDEKVTSIRFFVNSVELSTSANVGLTAANEFSYIQKSNLYETDNATDTIIATHEKRTVFTLGGYSTFNRLKGVATSILLDIMYFGIACITREQSAIFYDENFNYVTANSDDAEKLNDTGAREVNYYNSTNKLGAKVSSEILRPSAYDSDSIMIVWDSSANNYRKYYRRTPNKTLVAGAVVEGICSVKHYENL